ncbi:putative amidoligase enzyme-domain-containing protein [Xylariaceae sp. FL0255]|nr:putative amidoligase enzyme-domain-containing protein [Xylariaceae sp. FL0255]
MGKTTLGPHRLTHGVEVEFLVATLREDAPDPHEGTPGLPEVIRVPKTLTRFLQCRNYVLGHIRDTTREYFSGEPLKNALGFTVERDHMEYSLKEYSNFTFTDDPSIGGPDRDEYEWFGVEMTSPVAYDEPLAFEAITYAVNLLTSKFRCRVNKSCGLHVHVGQRAQLFSLDQLRRIAGLCFAIEPYLFTLHHPRRRMNTFCLPIRDMSALAEDKVPELGHDTDSSQDWQCSDLTGSVRRHGEYPMSSMKHINSVKKEKQAFLATRAQGHWEPFIPSSGATNAKPPKIILSPWRDDIPSVSHVRTRQIPRVRLPQYNKAILETLASSARVEGWFAHSGYGIHEIDHPEATGPILDNFSAAHSIYGLPSSCALAARLATPNRRGAVNFLAYQCYQLLLPISHKPTIEFRLAEGSLDGEWIATWAKICVGVVKFALQSSPTQFLEVISKCESAFKGDGSYDIIDVLDDMGLYVEAEIAEKRLSANKDQWNLQFAG